MLGWYNHFQYEGSPLYWTTVTKLPYYMRSGINCILYIVSQQLSPFQLYHIHLIYDGNGIWCFDGSQTPNIDWVMPWIGHWLWCRVTSRPKGGKFVATGSIWMIFFLSKIRSLLRTHILNSLMKEIQIWTCLTEDRCSVGEITNKKR